MAIPSPARNLVATTIVGRLTSQVVDSSWRPHAPCASQQVWLGANTLSVNLARPINDGRVWRVLAGQSRPTSNVRNSLSHNNLTCQVSSALVAGAGRNRFDEKGAT